MSLVFAQEFLDQVEADCVDLIQMHWDDIAVNKDRIKLNPDWDAYRDLEATQRLRIFTARNDGELVGYFVVLVGRGLHYKDHVFAANDIIFLHKDHRRGMAGVRLIKFAEACLMSDGVSVLTINTKTQRPFDFVLERLGFGLVERVYSKYIGGE